MIKIESGIPFPQNGRWQSKYPWRDLEVGQSFLVPDGVFRTMQAGASLAGRRLSKTFRARKTDDGIRIWRLA